MLTGFNTDVSFQGRVFHVQTEDRGDAHPVIESLVYCAGEIIAARRSPYDSLPASGASSEETLAKRMEAQHLRLIQEIQNGRFDAAELKPFGHDIVTNRSLDEVVAAFLHESFPIGQIQLRFTGPKNLRAGAPSTLRLEVVDRDTERPICGAVVSILLVADGTTPRELFTGETDDRGCAEARIVIPAAAKGTQLACQVKAAGRAAEIRRSVRGAEPVAAAAELIEDQRV